MIIVGVEFSHSDAKPVAEQVLKEHWLEFLSDSSIVDRSVPPFGKLCYAGAQRFLSLAAFH